jgi:hypothetical protein
MFLWGSPLLLFSIDRFLNIPVCMYNIIAHMCMYLLKVLVVPPIESLQRGTINPLHRNEFIKYSAYDAEGTWKLHAVLDEGWI